MQTLKSFTGISLKQMDEVKLMNRIDRKFWFNANSLESVLEEIKDDYFVLEISGKTSLPYSTIYFDTIDNEMFTAHHNGKLNRYKVRKRNYGISEKAFLEIKFKNNKGRTIKKRIPSNSQTATLTETEKSFISTTSPFKADYLQLSLKNQFNRLTLINKNFSERCTIDLDLEFYYNNKHIKLNDLAIVEIKTDSKSKNSPISIALRDNRLKASSFSKYCIGKSLLDNDVKKNAFKTKLRFIEKKLRTNKKIS